MYKTRQLRTGFWSSDVEKLHAAVAKSTFAVKMLKNWRSRSTFWGSDVEKLHAAVAKHTFWSENAKKLTVSEHFRMSKNCTPLWRNTHFEVKMLKNWRPRSTFWSSGVAKLHAAVAKRTCGHENAKKLTASEHFLKFRCRKIARCCGEKHISKWKCTKHVSSGQFFEVLMWKN